MKVPTRTLLLFNLDLPEIFFKLLWDKGHLLQGWEGGIFKRAKHSQDWIRAWRFKKNQDYGV